MQDTVPDEDVAAIAASGLRIVFRGPQYAHIRRVLRRSLHNRECGKANFERLYCAIEERMGSPAALPPRERLALMRLAIRLVSRGPRRCCPCRACRSSRKNEAANVARRS